MGHIADDVLYIFVDDVAIVLGGAFLCLGVVVVVVVGERVEIAVCAFQLQARKIYDAHLFPTHTQSHQASLAHAQTSKLETEHFALHRHSSFTLVPLLPHQQLVHKRIKVHFLKIAGNFEKMVSVIAHFRDKRGKVVLCLLKGNKDLIGSELFERLNNERKGIKFSGDICGKFGKDTVINSEMRIVVIFFLDPAMRKGLFGRPHPLLIKIEFAGVADMSLIVMSFCAALINLHIVFHLILPQNAANNIEFILMIDALKFRFFLISNFALLELEMFQREMKGKSVHLSGVFALIPSKDENGIVVRDCQVIKNIVLKRRVRQVEIKRDHLQQSVIEIIHIKLIKRIGNEGS